MNLFLNISEQLTPLTRMIERKVNLTSILKDSNFLITKSSVTFESSIDGSKRLSIDSVLRKRTKRIYFFLRDCVEILTFMRSSEDSSSKSYFKHPLVWLMLDIETLELRRLPPLMIDCKFFLLCSCSNVIIAVDTNERTNEFSLADNKWD